MKLEVSATGPAKPDTVWDRYRHPAQWSGWSPQILSVDYPGRVRATPDASITTGGRGTVHGPCGIGVAFEVLDVDDDKRCWSWRVAAAGVTLILVHDVAAHHSGSTTGLRIDGPAPVVVLYAPIARLALGRLVR